MNRVSKASRDSESFHLIENLFGDTQSVINEQKEGKAVCGKSVLKEQET